MTATEATPEAQEFLHAFLDFMEGFTPNPVVSIDREKNEILAHHDYPTEGPDDAVIVRLNAQRLWDAYPTSVEWVKRRPHLYEADDERTQVFMLLQESIDESIGSKQTPLNILVQVPGKPVFMPLLPKDRPVPENYPYSVELFD